MSTFRPGEEVELKGMRFRIAATNYEGKLILHPAGTREKISDMMVRLQSTAPADEPQGGK